MDINNLVKSLMDINAVESMNITKQQKDAIDALVVAYMSVVTSEFDKDVELAMMGKIDAIWDGLLVVDGDIYMKRDKRKWWWKSGRIWYEASDTENPSFYLMRSLADIRRIAELENQVDFEMAQKAKAREQRCKVTKRIAELEKYNIDLANESHDKSERITELERERDELKADVSELFKERKKLKLEQQIKALEDYAQLCGVLRCEPSTKSLREHINQLRNSAKGDSDGN